MMIVVVSLLVISQLKVGEITIEGNTFFTTGEIKAVMLTRTPGFFHKGTFEQEIFNGDLTAIVNLYRYEGFLDVMVSHDVNVDSTGQRVGIRIDIDEGQQTIVRSVVFTGNTVFTASVLNGRIATHAPTPYDKRKVDLDKHVITALYDDAGYADVAVAADNTISDHNAYITYRIEENEKQYVEKVEFIGLRRTDKKILLEEIPLKPGDVFRYATILKSQRNLYNLRLFRSVKAQVSDSDHANYKIVRFQLAEKKAVNFYFRIGYGTRDYLRLGAGVDHINLFGRAWRGEIDGKWSFAEYYLTSQVSFPRILFLPVRSSIGLFYKYREEIGFNTRNIGSNITVHFNMFEWVFSGRYSLESVRTYYDETTPEDDWLQGITFNWLKDRRNDPLFTKNGYYVNVLLETSGIVFPSDIDYVKPVFEIRVFRPLGMFVGAVALKTGVIEPVTPTTEIPVYKRYYCGGASSIRGYSEWSIGPHDAEGNPIGGRILAEASVELRVPIYGIVGGVLFCDAGNIWQDYKEVNTELRYGIGGGLRAKTPLGSVRLDYGFKIDRQPDESAGAWHFAIGEAF
jgi:outer membrane protein insertion porin family